MWNSFCNSGRNAQTDEICVLRTPQRKNETGELFSSTSRPRIDCMQPIRSRRAALTVVADLPRFFFSPENIDTNLCIHIFPGSVQKPPHTDPRHYRIGAAEQTASAVVCRIAPLCHFVDVSWKRACRMVREVQKTGICVWNICMQKAQCCQSRRRL